MTASDQPAASADHAAKPHTHPEARPGPPPFSAEKVAELRKKHNRGYVVGLHEVAGDEPRLDIDVFLNEHPKAFNLFLLALRDLQVDPSPMGYFEIAGIHGYPKRAWKGIDHERKTGASAQSPDNGNGYCEHSSLLFPSWHRPYLSMLEQSLYLQIVKKAEEFPDAYDQLQAAQSFRLPYWDYFRPRDYSTTFPGVSSPIGLDTYDYDFSVPQILTVERVIVTEPTADGDLITKTIANPLRSFWFPLTNSLKDEEWQALDSYNGVTYARGHTVRHALKYFWGNNDQSTDSSALKIRTAKAALQGSDEVLHLTANKARARNLTNIRDMILAPLQEHNGYRKYENFATNKPAAGEVKHDKLSTYEKEVKPAGSIEDFHNEWHVVIGGSAGHMGTTSIASFDPMFWLHHANVDRYIALWQVINPDSWFEDSRELLEKPLKPFLRKESKNGYWTSDAVQDTRTFGYSYPDIVRGDPEATKHIFIEQELWSLADKPRAPKEKTPLDLSQKLAFLGNPEYIKLSDKIDREDDRSAEEKAHDVDHKSELSPELQRKRLGFAEVEWYIDTKVLRHALNGPFGIYFFVGESNDEVKTRPEEFLIAPTLAGLTYNFAAQIEACANCAQHKQDELEITSTTVITQILRDYKKGKKLDSLKPDHVIPFLKQRLAWRIVLSSGELVTGTYSDLHEKYGLKLLVNSAEISVQDGKLKQALKLHKDVVETIVEKSKKPPAEPQPSATEPQPSTTEYEEHVHEHVHYSVDEATYEEFEPQPDY